MAFSVVMPALEMAQETGKLIAWLKKEGDRVTKGEPLLEIETDKAVMEVEAPADGVLAGITGSVGADIPVGQTIAWIVSPGEKPPAEKQIRRNRARSARENGISRRPSRGCCCRISGRSEREDFSEGPAPREELGVDIASLARLGPGRRNSCVGRASRSRARGFRFTHQEISQPRAPSTLGRLMAERTDAELDNRSSLFLSRVKSMRSRSTNIGKNSPPKSNARTRSE